MTRKIFKTASLSEFWKNAHVGFEDNWSYALGYIDGANELVEMALAKPHVRDRLFRTICFLYRHACELILKELIRDSELVVRVLVECGENRGAGSRQPKEVDDLLASTHSLEKLLNELEKRLGEFSEQELPEDVRAAVLELHNVDPSGEAFRYARRRDGQEHGRHLRDLHQVDLVHLRNQISTALQFLEGGVGGWLANELDTAADYLHELNSYGP